MNAKRWSKRKHDNVVRIAHCKNSALNIMWGNLERDDKWYVHTLEKVIENKEVKILWDVIKQSDKEIEARKPDIVTIKKEKNCRVIDISMPMDITSTSKKEKNEVKEDFKISGFQDRNTKNENITSDKVVPVICSALWSSTKHLKNCINELREHRYITKNNTTRTALES